MVVAFLGNSPYVKLCKDYLVSIRKTVKFEPWIIINKLLTLNVQWNITKFCELWRNYSLPGTVLCIAPCTVNDNSPLQLM